MRKLAMLLYIFFCLYTSMSRANEAISLAIPDASVVGRGVLSYAFWDVYEATLYAPKGYWQPTQPFALSIKYYRALNGKKIADRSVQEMRNQGIADEVKLAAWHSQMKIIFPGVEKGTILSAIYWPGKETIFYNGNEAVGVIKGEDFGRAFFDIWLSEKTSEPQLRNALLGLK